MAFVATQRPCRVTLLSLLPVFDGEDGFLQLGAHLFSPEGILKQVAIHLVRPPNVRQKLGGPAMHHV